MAVFKQSRVLLGIALLFAALPALAADAALELATASGVSVKPLALHDAKAAVFVFVIHDCPICNAYAPELERLRLAYEPKGIAIYLVQTDPELKAADALKHAAEYGFKGTVLMDVAHKLSQSCGAKTAPEAAVVGADGKTLYLGRIDDLFADFGQRRANATTHDLRAALDAIFAGLPAPKAAGPAIGCFISEIKEPKK